MLGLIIGIGYIVNGIWIHLLKMDDWDTCSKDVRDLPRVWVRIVYTG